jgi:hypothetical protein
MDDTTKHFHFTIHNEETLSLRSIEIATQLQDAISRVNSFFESDEYKAATKEMVLVSDYIKSHRKTYEALSNENLKDLIPFIRMEIESELPASSKEMPLREFLKLMENQLETILEQGFDDAGEPIADSPHQEIIQRAMQRQAGFQDAKKKIAKVEQTKTELEQITKEIPRITPNMPDAIKYPLDKPNSMLWNFAQEMCEQHDRQNPLAFDTTSDKDKRSGKEALIYYAIDFNEIEGEGVKITKQLTPFDKRVYFTVANLFNAGNDVITATQIHKLMGNKGLPKAGQLQRIHDSLTKMGAAHIYIDSTQEVKINKGYTKFKYDASLLPFERISAYVKGVLTENAIHLFREPPLFTFARERKQITAFPRKILESPVNKTDGNLMLEDYLLFRISRMKNDPKLPKKILYTKIYEKCSIPADRKKRQRVRETVDRYLEHLKDMSYIMGYSPAENGVTIKIKPLDFQLKP